MNAVRRHLETLFPDTPRLLRLEAEGLAMRATFAAADGATVELLLHPPGTATAHASVAPSCDVVVPPGQVSDEAAAGRIAAVLRILEADDRGLDRVAWWRALGPAADERFLAGDVAEVKITAACDQACVFCKSPSTLANHASLDEVRDALPRLARRADLLTLSGGEPTQVRELPELVAQARSAGFGAVELQTNGMNLDDPARVAELMDAGLTNALVSLHAHEPRLSDGLTGVPGGFARTLAALDHLARTGISLSLCHVICEGNHPHLVDFARFVRRRFERRFLHVVFTLAIPTYRVRDEPGLLPSLAAVGPELRAALRLFAPVYRGPATLPEWLRRRGPSTSRVAAGARRASLRLLGRAPLRRLLPIHRARVLAQCGLPPCVLGDQLAHHDEIGRTTDLPATAELVHVPPCEACVLRSRCSGLWQAWVSRFGHEGIEPVVSGSVLATTASSMIPIG